jgi:mono/diheme cytochrome c family protein
MKPIWITVLILLGATALWAGNDSWIAKVSIAQRDRVNPYAGNQQASAAGKILFAEHCAQCHGKDAHGLRGPSLRSLRIEQATDGELAWILKNGYVRGGMPSWSRLPEPERWQIIAYLRSLPHEGSREIGIR